MTVEGTRDVVYGKGRELAREALYRQEARALERGAEQRRREASDAAAIVSPDSTKEERRDG